MNLNLCAKVAFVKRFSATQIVKVMKLTILLITIACLQVSAKAYSQITLTKKNTPLIDVLNTIQQQTGYTFFYKAKLIANIDVDVNLHNATLQQALDQVLDDLMLTYEVNDKTVSIKPAKISFLKEIKDKANKFFAGPSDITGKVLDSAGRGLAGANLRLEGTDFSTVTDNNGWYHFNKVPQGTYAIYVTYIGYIRQEKTIVVNGKDLTINFILKGSSSPLDQVQVIGYGADTKRFSVGSVSTVTAEQIEKQPVTNILLALAGQAPGLAVNATTGVPGSRVLVQVRGQNSLDNSPLSQKPYDQPLFLVDGVPFATQNANISQLSSLATLSRTNGGISQAGGISPFNNINLDDIESITILKDADATSIYGSQGANGVILITTKKGKAGKTTFKLNVNSSFNSEAKPISLLNTPQYLQYRKDAFAADAATPTTTSAPDITVFDQNKYTDWQHVVYGKTSNNTNVHGSLSGGTNENTFLISGGFTRSDFNYPGDYADQKVSLHSAIHHQSIDNKFTVNFVADYGYDQNNSPAFGGSSALLLAPNTPDLLSPSGGLNWYYKGFNLNGYQFYNYLKQPTSLQNYNLNSSLHLVYKIVTGLTIGADVGYNRNTTASNSQNPAAAQTPAYAPYVTASFANMIAQTINVEPQINYTKNIGNGLLTALVGATYRKILNFSNTTTGSGYSNDNFLGSINGATTVFTSDASNIYKYNAVFGRLKYVYAQKYIISLTGRRDGSSTFGPGRQFGNFGSAGVGWIMSEERAFQKALPFISYAKLSGSYGTTGSDIGSAYMYQPLFKPVTSSTAFQGVSPSAPYNLYNPDFSWAVKKSLNAALDLGFFNNRLLLNATYYREREGNQLVSYPLPIQTGFGNVFENLDANIQNKGMEFSLSSTNIKTKNFLWTTSFNLAFNRNKLLSFPNLAASSYNSLYIIGQPTSIIFGYKYKDVNPQTGLFEYYDRNGNVTSAPKYGLVANGGDQVPIANQEVNYMGGFGNTLNYKHFSLYVFCQFSSQNALNYLSRVYNTNAPSLSVSNVPAAIFGNYWKNPGDNAMLQRLASGYGSVAYKSASYFSQSSGVYDNDTYLRVKTVSLSYALPESWLKKLSIQSGSIFLNAQNLFTITNYKVGDPEQPGDFTTFPLQRIIGAGLNLNF